MMLAMTLLVRDEVDIVADNIEFHLAAGVDFVVAVDNGSVDGTRDILESYRRLGVAALIDEPGRDYSQDLWVTRAALAARDIHGADWILNNDADEFWCAREGDLKDIVRRTGADVLTCERRNMICASEALDDACWRELARYRVARPVPRQLPADPLRDPLPVPYFYFALPPKALVRAEGLTKIGMGNHSAERIGDSTSETPPVDIYHFPVRGRAHFEKKVIEGSAAYAANTRLPATAGWHWRRWSRILRENGLDAALADALPSAARLAADLADGTVIEDPRAPALLATLTLRIPGFHQQQSEPIANRLPDVVYNNDPALDRFIFLCGLHRSGTTLLERMLTARFEVSYLRATVPESEGQHMQSVYRAAKHYGGPGRFAFSNEMRAELKALLSDPKECRLRIIGDWKRFVVGKSTTVLEKSPTNLTKIHWLRQVFPGSHFVILSRDPRAVSAATQKWSETSLSELMRHWDKAYSQAILDYREEDCIIIRYEDLCDDPEAEIRRVAQFLGLVPRRAPETLEKRHNRLVNSNTKYLEMHGDTSYGPGIWDHFGYDL